MNGVLALLLVACLGALVAGLVKPTIFNSVLKGISNRKQIALYFGSASLVTLLLLDPETGFTILFFAASVLTVIGFANPKVFEWLFKQHATKGKLSSFFAGLVMVSLIGLGMNGNAPSELLIDVTTPGTLTIEAPVNEDLDELETALLVKNSLAAMVYSYVNALIETDVFVSEPYATYADHIRAAQYDTMMAAWANADAAATEFESLIATLDASGLLTDGAVARISGTAIANHFLSFPQALAFTRDQVLAVYDRAPNREKLKAVAAMLHTDVRTANDIMHDIHNKNIKENLSTAEAYTRYRDGAQVLATGSKVLVAIGGIAASGGTLAVAGGMSAKVATAAKIGAVTVSGADLVLEVGEVGLQIGVWDRDLDPEMKKKAVTALRNAREWAPLKTADTVVSIYEVGKGAATLVDLYNKRSLLKIGNRRWRNINRENYAEAVDEFKEALSGSIVSLQELGLEGEDKVVLAPGPKPGTFYLVPVADESIYRDALRKGETLTPEDLRKMFHGAGYSPDELLLIRDINRKYQEELKRKEEAKPPAPKPNPLFIQQQTPEEPAPVPPPTPEPTPPPLSETPPPQVYDKQVVSDCNLCWQGGLSCVCGTDTCRCCVDWCE